jgi:hypothetical protein
MKKFILAIMFLPLLCTPQSTMVGKGAIVGNSTLTAGGGGGTGNFTYVQGGPLCQGASPLTCSFSPTAGHGIVIGAYACADSGACTTAIPGGTTIAIKDNVNNPETCFTAAPSSPVLVSDSGGFHLVWYWWVCPSIPSGVTSFTITNSSGSGYEPIWISEVTGSSFTGVIDKDGAAVSASSGTSASVPTTAATTNAQDICLAMIDYDHNSGGQTVGSGWTARFNDGTNDGVLQTLLTSATGTQTATATWVSSDSWFGEIVCVK